MKVTIIAGARPNFMKIAPLMRAIKAAKAAGKEAMIYAGPTVPGIVIAGTVFNNGFPEKLKKEMETKNVLLKNGTSKIN